MQKRKIIVAISGASGAIYGINLLISLKNLSIETHLIISESAIKTIEYETNYNIDQVKNFADYIYDNRNFASSIASGSFYNEGMIISPCSIKTMSQIALCNNDNLIARAADVTLKERRKLILMVRESPLHLGHLKNMLAVTEMGGIIAPPMPALYALPKTIDDIINNTVGRIIDLFGIKNDLVNRWKTI